MIGKSYLKPFITANNECIAFVAASASGTFLAYSGMAMIHRPLNDSRHIFRTSLFYSSSLMTLPRIVIPYGGSASSPPLPTQTSCSSTRGIPDYDSRIL
eukprot:g29658.t1